MKKVLQNDNFIGLALALAAFCIYLSTLAPTVSFIDSGELATDVATLGIAHPTGYPLFTLLGWAFIHLLPGVRVIWKLNLFAALLCSIAVFFFHRLFLFLLSEKTRMGFDVQKKQNLKKDQGIKMKENSYSEKMAAAVAALILAFSETYWSQATSIEVYPLHLFFLSVVLLLFTHSMLEHARNPWLESNRSWYLFALALGLSFTNHMTTILLAPGFLYLYFATHGFSAASWKKIGKAVVPFLLGLSVYLYLPLRASQKPLMNWGNPATLERILWHVSGKQFRVWMFSSFDVAGQQFAHFTSTFLAEFGYAPVLFAVIGLASLFRRSRKMLAFTLLLFFGCLIYSINYDIHDIDSYFLLAYVATVIWVAYGIHVFLDYAKGKAWQSAAWMVCGALVLPTLFLHYRDLDESRDYTVEDYTKNMLESVDSGAVLLSSQWDYFIAAAYYFQRVEGVRSDVTVIDKELLRRSWYYTQLGTQCPWLIANSRAEVDALLPELYKFEHDLPYNPAVIEARYEAMIRSFIGKSFETRHIYVTSEIGAEFTQGFQRIPVGLAFRLFHDSIPKAVPPKEFSFHPFPKSNFYVEGVKSLYAAAYVNQGIYLTMQGNKEKSAAFMRKALEVKPGSPDALAWLQRLGEGR